jgi:hypothetical protein
MRFGSAFRSLTLAVLVLGLAASSASAQFTGKYKRMKLLEQYTSATCPPCATAAPFVEAAVKLESDVISLRYHMNYPAPGDPWNVMNSRDPQIRHDLYGINGIPYLRVGGTASINPTAGVAAINNLISQIPPTSMAKIDVVQKGGKVEVTVTTDRALTGAKLFFATVQRTVTISNLPSTLPNSNGESKFGDIMMFMYPDANGTEINQAAGETRVYTFTPGMGSGREWNPANLYGIAFLQDDATKEIIQAGASVTADTPPAFDYFERSNVSVAVSGQFDRVDRSGTREKTVTLTNTGSAAVEVELLVTNGDEIAQLGGSAVIEPAKVNVPAKGTATAKLKVTGPDRSVFFGVSTGAAAPDGLGSIVPPVYMLVNGGRIVNYYGFSNEGPALTQLAAQASTRFGKDVVYMPFSTQILTAYPTADFDGAIYALDAAWTSLRGDILNSVKNTLDAGKAVWIQTQAGMYAANERYATNAAFNDTRAFYTNVAGIKYTKFDFRVTVANNQITAINSFKVNGVASDPIGNGLNITANQFNQASWPYFAQGTDIFAKASASSKAVPVLYYDNDQTKVGMVRVETNGGGRLVYSSIGLESIATESVRNTLAERVITWMLGETTPTPKIAVSKDLLNFENLEVGKTKQLSFTIANPGTANLELNSVRIAGMDASMFTITEGAVSGKTVVAAGESRTITVEFAPSEAKQASATLTVSSNVEDKTVQLRGNAVTSSVETDVVSETGAIGMTLVGANPVATSSAIRLRADGEIRMTIVNAAGQEVATIFNGSVRGTEMINVDASMLASGAYTVVATNGADRAVLTVVVSR